MLTSNHVLCAGSESDFSDVRFWYQGCQRAENLEDGLVSLELICLALKASLLIIVWNQIKVLMV